MAEETKPAKTFPVYLGYDVWNENGERIAGHGLDNDGDIITDGEPISLPIDLAKSLIAEKKAVRGDPMPK